MRKSAFDILFTITAILILGVGLHAQSNDKALLSTYISDKGISGNHLYEVVSSLARTNKVPISLEPRNFTRPGNDKAEDGAPRIQPGTLESVMDQLIAFYPEFKWKLDDGVVSVFPKNDRDTVIDQLLSIEIREISFDKRIGAMSVGSEITETEEVETKLKSLDLTPIHFFNSIKHMEIEQGGLTSIFIMRNKSVREILNQVVKESKSKYWTIARWGDKGEIFTIIVS